MKPEPQRHLRLSRHLPADPVLVAIVASVAAGAVQ